MRLILMYLAAIVVANLSVAHFGPASTIINAFLFIGFDITARDKLHEKWKGKRLWLNMAVLIAVGSLITYALNRDAGPVAFASIVAFSLSGAADTITYHLLQNRKNLVKVNGSNITSAVVDSIVFPTIAFGTLMPQVVIGQFVAKVIGGCLWSLVINKKRSQHHANHTLTLL